MFVQEGGRDSPKAKICSNNDLSDHQSGMKCSGSHLKNEKKHKHKNRKTKKKRSRAENTSKSTSRSPIVRHQDERREGDMQVTLMTDSNVYIVVCNSV